jgi:hypothetical protein
LALNYIYVDQNQLGLVNSCIGASGAAYGEKVGSVRGFDGIKTCTLHVFESIHLGLRISLVKDYIPRYLASPEWKAIQQHPSGRTWGIIKTCKRARELSLGIETKLALSLAELVKLNQMDQMYANSTELDGVMKARASQLLEITLEYRENIETVVMITKANFVKNSYRERTIQQLLADKANMSQQANN